MRAVLELAVTIAAALGIGVVAAAAVVRALWPRTVEPPPDNVHAFPSFVDVLHTCAACGGELRQFELERVVTSFGGPVGWYCRDALACQRRLQASQAFERLDADLNGEPTVTRLDEHRRGAP